MNKILTRDIKGAWNTDPPTPTDKINNVNCHKFVLYAIGRISWEEMISDPEEQRVIGIDFTFGNKILSISDCEYKLIIDEENLQKLANNCEIGKFYIGQVRDAQTEEMAHSFILKRESDSGYVCFDKPGFKYPFAVSDLASIINFVNKDGEQSNKNQLWRFVPLDSVESDY